LNEKQGWVIWRKSKMIIPDEWKAAILNFLIPGTGFFFSRRIPIMTLGALIFLLSLHPWFSNSTILSVLGMVIMMPEQLTMGILEPTFGWSFLLSSFAYITAKYANGPIDRYDVGIVLAFTGGITSTLIQSFRFVYLMHIPQSAIFYLFGVVIGLLVMAGSFIAYKESKVAGGMLVLLPSMSFLVDVFLILLPIPVGSIILLYMPFAFGSPWLLFSLLGGVLLLSAKKS